jgi:hypothetical protein
MGVSKQYHDVCVKVPLCIRLIFAFGCRAPFRVLAAKSETNGALRGTSGGHKYQMPHKPTSPELSPSRGILSRLEFPLLLTFLISLSSYLLSLLIYMAVHFTCYNIVERFVGSCAAALVRIFRLIC